MYEHFSSFYWLLATSETEEHNQAKICMNISQPFIGFCRLLKLRSTIKPRNVWTFLNLLLAFAKRWNWGAQSIQNMYEPFSTFYWLLPTAETEEHNQAKICINIFQPFIGFCQPLKLRSTIKLRYVWTFLNLLLAFANCWNWGAQSSQEMYGHFLIFYRLLPSAETEKYYWANIYINILKLLWLLQTAETDTLHWCSQDMCPKLSIFYRLLSKAETDKARSSQICLSISQPFTNFCSFRWFARCADGGFTTHKTVSRSEETVSLSKSMSPWWRSANITGKTYI
jgi:hypothetical protein